MTSAPRGPKPTSRLEWSADPVSAHAIRARWIGSLWHYRIDWGDGTSERVLAFQPPVRHVYPQAGIYTLVARSELDTKVTATAEVVLRDYARLPVTAQLLPGSTTVRLSLPAPADPVRFLVDWGDGTSSQHGPGDAAPEHTYTPPRAVSVVWESGGAGVGRLRGYGFPPGVAVSARLEVGQPHAQFSALADADGGWSLDYRYAGGSPWRAGVVHWNTDGRRQAHYVDVPVPFGGDTLHVTYGWDHADPRSVTLTVAPAQNGAYGVDWGDGTPAETVRLTPGRPYLPHTYAAYGTYTVTVTDPAGRTGSRVIGPPQVTWRQDRQLVSVGLASAPGLCCPLRVDWGLSEPAWPVHLWRTPPNSASYANVYPPGDYQVTVYAPMQDPLAWRVSVPERADGGSPVGDHLVESE